MLPIRILGNPHSIILGEQAFRRDTKWASSDYQIPVDSHLPACDEENPCSCCIYPISQLGEHGEAIAATQLL